MLASSDGSDQGRLILFFAVTRGAKDHRFALPFLGFFHRDGLEFGLDPVGYHVARDGIAGGFAEQIADEGGRVMDGVHPGENVLVEEAKDEFLFLIG